jgi:23S rRNA (pseudouridine1915-N3)-methyltransferase
MKITIVAIGKTDETYISEGIEQYIKRVSAFIPIDLDIIVESKNHCKLSVAEQMEEEAKWIMEKLNAQDVIVLLDERGKTYNSVEFSKQMERWLQMGKRRLVFVIGGSFGIHESLKSKYPMLSLSAMTFNHQMIRLFLLEQIYRAFTIIKGHPYHK